MLIPLKNFLLYIELRINIIQRSIKTVGMILKVNIIHSTFSIAKRSKSKNSKRSSIKPGMGKMENPLKISFQKPSRLESSTPKLIEAVTKIYQDKIISK